MPGQPQPTTQTGTVRLRGHAGPLPVTVCWPPRRSRPHRPRRLLVALDVDLIQARTLCAGTGRVVLAITATGPPTLDDLCELVTWAAAHGTELGARPDDLLVTGARTATAAALRHRARAEGWPRLAVLGDPDSDVELDVEIDPSRSLY